MGTGRARCPSSSGFQRSKRPLDGGAGCGMEAASFRGRWVTRGPWRRRTEQLNTPVNNPPLDDPTEVEVTDPTHPLFGRRFTLLSTRPRPHSVGYIFVAYRDAMVLRIPEAVTDLVSPPPESAPMTKLTSHALTELVSLAEQCEVLCPATPSKSGSDSHPHCKPVSAPTSRRSSRR
jgi:Family of unknown function (DUF5372)